MIEVNYLFYFYKDIMCNILVSKSITNIITDGADVDKVRQKSKGLIELYILLLPPNLKDGILHLFL